MKRPSRPLASALLGAALLVGLPASNAVAQEPPAPPGTEEGSPFMGYFATGILAAFTLFLIARTARR